MAHLSNLLPLVILFLVVAVGGYVGYQIYLWSNELADRGRKKMEQKHVSFTKDGMKVGVKQVSDEDYAAAQQSWVVKTWNASSFPAYKSRLWNKEEQARQKKAADDAKRAHLQATSSGSSTARQ